MGLGYLDLFMKIGAIFVIADIVFGSAVKYHYYQNKKS